MRFLSREPEQLRLRLLERQNGELHFNADSVSDHEKIKKKGVVNASSIDLKVPMKRNFLMRFSKISGSKCTLPKL